ncbi:putative sulfate exporter family transporter [Tissierella carlieri]|uniref:Sulfate exporter family transporter n=1 Tax=Tissierella carlieri TaxID=689904 RepID=A0ABT1SCT6_9FIRM|nr:putative sulfate exporter family transporter [Tissierella carlieri]MCQ4924268.1 putative sulfate exporter family transporter [Tissierella carlieri]
MKIIKKYSAGILLTVILAYVSMFISDLIPGKLISAGVFSLLLGMAINPIISNYNILNEGMSFVSKKVLRLAIILMGATLSFSQVFEVGKYSLIVMTFTLFAAFAGGYYLGKLFNMNWKLSGLISAGTGICGGSAVAAIAPTIDAEANDIAYAISATFIFDIVMVVLFPIAGRYFGMSDLGYGLWTGTAVNDTSSVVAAGYAFSDAAGNFSLIVKLTRTLSIVPAVLVFSFINERLNSKYNISNAKKEKIDLKKIFPWFIVIFLLMVGIKSLGIISASASTKISIVSKFFMVMSLGAIGLKTNFKEVSKSGFLPMLHGFIISLLVVVVSFMVQMFMGQI